MSCVITDVRLIGLTVKGDGQNTLRTLEVEYLLLDGKGLIHGRHTRRADPDTDKEILAQLDKLQNLILDDLRASLFTEYTKGDENDVHEGTGDRQGDADQF
jgi:hypothetical protein